MTFITSQLDIGELGEGKGRKALNALFGFSWEWVSQSDEHSPTPHRQLGRGHPDRLNHPLL
jgi:hypothetical protein